MPEILTLKEITDQAVGGKAAGLAELTRHGLNVPPAFVVVAASAEHFPDDLEAQYQAIGGGKVAVRSSAIGEDGEDSSFAGQYETILNVEGLDALKAAIAQCVQSLDSAQATAYKSEHANLGEVEMCVVVQRMVDAHSAGVLFTADPVTGRHDRLVIDAVRGLGEALVSGEVTPDHYELDRNNHVVRRELTGESPILSDAQIQALAKGARDAAVSMTPLLDMEWAIDASGDLFWLQARPITTLGSDLNELDTPIPDDHVITRCNVGEMMPGAVCPLTFSVQGRAIEHGMQHMHVCYANRPAINQEWTQINLFFGHMFINMTGGLQSSRYVSINTVESMGQSLCGRPVPELKPLKDLAPFWRRWYGTWQFARYVMQSQKVLTEFESRFKHAYVSYTNDSLSMMKEINRYFPWICETNEVHLRSSAFSGVMEGIVQSFVAGGSQPPDADQQAEAARLLAGASDVESAVMVDRLDDVVDLIAEHPEAVTSFQKVDPSEALAWLTSEESGAARYRFEEFLAAHGHRSIRELCVREAGWVDEPEKLIVTMQASLASRLQGAYKPRQVEKVDISTLSRGLRFMLPVAHNAIRRREHTKSLLVLVTHRLKRAYRHLANLLVSEGHLPDADLVFFFTHEELNEFVENPSSDGVSRAEKRRIALSFHEKMEFDDVYVGKPEPLVWEPPKDAAEGELIGRPVSRGIVEGAARVALTIQEAAELQPGEILIAPITDIGWTPYFSLIAGLATDVGSAVSHGAVIAREYGLPAIVNLRQATRLFKTGDRVRLDADKGVLSRL
ncbi:pyruvate,water dikinase [Litorivivens lipolytica]|uniref:Pyruvate,water dikinase n=1 Tax=Litorivivens lipolytica TaxID=1524264 RepID=A0A7W4W5T9_9GAMM|nr:PEP/pyruvate-binding domain-containing protein [Litorivivens lipolytica]MBB3047979.1 pyruvate,water dikinase [Litorivivens lipolytica]